MPRAQERREDQKLAEEVVSSEPVSAGSSLLNNNQPSSNT